MEVICKKFLNIYPIYKNIYFLIFGGTWAPLMSINGYQNVRARRPHHRADICIQGKNNHPFFIYGPQCEKIAFLAIRGAVGDPSIIRLDPSCFPAMESICQGFI